MRLILSRLLFVMAAMSLVFGLAVGFSWYRDRQVLRAAAERAVAGATSESDRLTRLLGWVYSNQGFEKNKSYFLWKKLDATPVQVLEKGGDCEDKSKLFATMLREIGVKSSLAMLYPEPNSVPSHVVTLVRTSSGETPMDAVFNISFPDGHGGFTDVSDIKADKTALLRRLDQLVSERGTTDKIALYKRTTENYPYVTTINWDKNFITRAVAGFIRATGGEPWRTPRPLFLDDPKQFFMILGVCGAAGQALLAVLIRPRGPRRRPA